MLDLIIRWSLKNRFLVILLSLSLVGVGLLASKKLALDAFPDISPVQVQVNAVAPALNPEEIEQQITFPIERRMGGLPGLINIRSISKFGFSQVILTFEDDYDIYLARQLVSEKLSEVSLPTGINPPSLGPISTGLGEVFHYLVRGDKHTLQELTTIQNWVIKPRLATVPGVAEINTWGGKNKQYQIQLNLDHMLQYSISLEEIREALLENNLNVGGGRFSQAGEYLLVHGIGILTDIDEIKKVLVTYREEVPIYIRDLAEVKIGHEIRRGAATAFGKGETVLGLGFMLKGENSFAVTKRLEKKALEIQKDLPDDVSIEILYLRTNLIDSVIKTIEENLLTGAILVIAILFWFLGNLRAGLIVAMAIPLSMLFAFTEMLQFGIAGSLMSLGAIDFGLIVDSSVILVENSIRKLNESEPGACPKKIIEEASLEVRRPTMFGELIILVVFIPILTLEGIEGKLFIPMALTMIFALLGSLILSLTFTPVMASFFLRKSKQHTQNPMMGMLKSLYRPLLEKAIHFKIIFLGLGAGVLLIGLLLANRLGSEFVPRLFEGSIAINTIRLAGVSLEESVRYGTRIEDLILNSFPDEVEAIWTRTGTAQTATDPMGLELSDVYITLKNPKIWKRASTQEDLTGYIREKLDGLPGMRSVFTQPIEMRVNEMSSGIRADLGVKIFGDSFERLKEIGERANRILGEIPGARDLYLEQITGQGVLSFKINQDAISRHGIHSSEILRIIQGLGEIHVGEIREEQKRFDLILKLQEQFAKSPEIFEAISIPTRSGKVFRLGDLVDIEQKEAPSTITREWQKRRITLQCNVSGRDLGTFVEDVKTRLDQELELPNGYFLEFGGQYENLLRARNRLKLVIPAALILILCLLFLSTGRVSDSLIIFTGAPFAAVGGVLLLYFRGMPFTISAAVGFVAVSGVGMLNGLVMMSTIRQNLAQGLRQSEAIIEGALTRLRPVLMTALVAAVGFIPMALNTGFGAEVQKPLATVVIGGVFTDCLLTLCLLPALASLFMNHDQAGSE